MLRLYSTFTLKQTISINGEIFFKDFLSPYPDLEKNSFNKHKRHNQIKRWISSESMNTIDMNQNELNTLITSQIQLHF
jgi:hypothetical protein